MPNVILLALVFALVGFIAGYLLARNDLLPERERKLSDSFEKAVTQLHSPEVQERLYGILALEGIALASARYRAHVFRLFADFLRARSDAHNPAIPERTVMMDAEAPNDRVEVDVRAIVESLGRLTRRAKESELAEIDLSHTNLSGARLARTNLSGVTMVRCTLASTDLTGAQLRGVNFTGSNLQYVRLQRANLAAQAPGLLRAALTAPLKDFAILVLSVPMIPIALGSVLGIVGPILAAIGITLTSSFLVLLLPGLILLRVLMGIFYGISSVAQTITNTKHVRRIVEEIELDRSDLEFADLRHADLRSANLFGANLRGAKLAYADMRRTILYRADLRGADLSMALNLYQGQINRAIVDTNTLVPPHIRLRGITPESEPRKASETDLGQLELAQDE